MGVSSPGVPKDTDVRDPAEGSVYRTSSLGEQDRGTDPTTPLRPTVRQDDPWTSLGTFPESGRDEVGLGVKKVSFLLRSDPPNFS